MSEEPIAVDVRRVDGPPDHYLDAAERLERVIDAQIETLEGIDEKAEHVTRLVGVLLGVVLSVLSVAVQTDAVRLSPVSSLTLLAFGVGVTGLLLSMIAAVVTYLSSKFEVGVRRTVGKLLSREDYEIESKTYARRTLGTYSHNIRRNKRVIAENARRFRWTLVFLLAGVIYLALSAVLYVGRVLSMGRGGPVLTPDGELIVVLCTTTATMTLIWYVLSGRYLTLQDEGTTDD